MLKTVQVTMPKQLLEQLDEFLATSKMTRSGFVRRAVAEELRRARITAMERQHEEAYRRQPITEEEEAELDLWQSVQEWGDPWPNP